MLTPLSAVPSRQNPSTFSDDMDAFLNWLLTVYLPWANSIENNFQFTATTGTNSESMTIRTGLQIFTTQINKAWAVGSYVYIVYSSDVSKLMVGQVTAYNNSTGLLSVNVTTTMGSGTYASWSIGLAVPDVAALSLSGGATGSIPFQSSPSVTSMLAAGSANRVLQANGAAAPSWVSPESMVASADAAGANNMPRLSQVQALITAATPQATTSANGTVELATSAEVIAGTDAARAVTPLTLHAGKMVTSAVQATTSGTLVDFTGVPSWARRLTLMMKGVSSNGSADFLVRLGTGAGFAATGYSSYYSYLVNDTNAATGGSTVGLGISSGSPVASFNGIVSIVLMDASTNSWVSSHCGGDSGGTSVKQGGGSVSLPGVLTSLRFMTANGTDTFDGGSISLMWE